MTKTWFAADLHFSHNNIIKFTKADGSRLRPFDSIEEHDYVLIENWNRVVKPEDKVYVLGDVIMPKRGISNVAKLNGRKILIAGNHDMLNAATYIGADGGDVYFDDVRAVKVFEGLGWVCTHIPIHPASMERWTHNIHGHLHSNQVMLNDRPDPRYFCVSMEHIGFTPISLDELKVKIDDRGH